MRIRASQRGRPQIPTEENTREQSRAPSAARPRAISRKGGVEGEKAPHALLFPRPAHSPAPSIHPLGGRPLLFQCRLSHRAPKSHRAPPPPTASPPSAPDPSAFPRSAGRGYAPRPVPVAATASAGAAPSPPVAFRGGGSEFRKRPRVRAEVSGPRGTALSASREGARPRR